MYNILNYNIAFKPRSTAIDEIISSAVTVDFIHPKANYAS